MSHPVPFYSEVADHLYSLIDCDKLYVEYVKMGAYAIRLSHKTHEEHSNLVRTYVCDVGNQKYNATCLDIMNLIDTLSEQTHPLSLLDSHDDTAYKKFIHDVLNQRRLVSKQGMFMLPEFLTWYLKQKPRTKENMLILVPHFIEVMKRPQRLLFDSKDYFIAMDISTKVFYINYMNILMLDIDDVSDVSFQMKFLTRNVPPDSVCMVYRTRRGLHVFFVDRSRDFLHSETIENSILLGSDARYVLYTMSRGWSVRVSPKQTEKEDKKLYRFLGWIGQRERERRLGWSTSLFFMSG